MVGLVFNLTPIEIRKLQKKLQKERDIISSRIKISKKVRNGIKKDPIKRNKFQID
jgi:hypothetical protein